MARSPLSEILILFGIPYKNLISNKFPGDADAASLGSYFEIHCRSFMIETGFLPLLDCNLWKWKIEASSLILRLQSSFEHYSPVPSGQLFSEGDYQ